jgi:hypothetical protein
MCLQQTKHIAALPVLARLCPHVRLLDLKCQVNDWVLQQLALIPVIENLRVCGFHSLTTNFSQHDLKWKSLEVRSELLEYKALGYLPLSHLESSIQWTTSTKLQVNSAVYIFVCRVSDTTAYVLVYSCLSI